MNLIEGADRREVLFFPECLDDYIPQDSPVRFIDAFVPWQLLIRFRSTRWIAVASVAFRG